MSTAPARVESSSLRNLMVAASVIGALLLMASFGVLMMSPMLFDSGEGPEAWTIFTIVWLMPVVLIAGLVIGWIGFARDARRMVIAGLCIAAVPPLLALGVIVMAGA